MWVWSGRVLCFSHPKENTLTMDKPDFLRSSKGRCGRGLFQTPPLKPAEAQGCEPEGSGIRWKTTIQQEAQLGKSVSVLLRAELEKTARKRFRVRFGGMGRAGKRTAQWWTGACGWGSHSWKSHQEFVGLFSRLVDLEERATSLDCNVATQFNEFECLRVWLARTTGAWVIRLTMSKTPASGPLKKTSNPSLNRGKFGPVHMGNHHLPTNKSMNVVFG